MLALCLRSLGGQSIPPDEIDVLVIDNNSSDHTRSVVEDAVEYLSRLRYVFEPSQGLSFARNRALVEAQGDWIVYLDDDAVVHGDWFKVVREVVDSDIFDCFGGVYLPWHYFRNEPHWFDRRWATNCHVQTSFGPLNEDAYISGGNCAMRRQVAIDCGQFPVGVGMAGHRVSYGEETQLFDRMKYQGFRLGFVPHMLIDHCVMPYKYAAVWHLKSAFASGRDNCRMNKKRNGTVSLGKSCVDIGVAFLSGLKNLAGNLLVEQKKPWRLVYINAIRRLANAMGVAYGLIFR